MRFLTVRDFRSRPTEVWKELEVAGEVVITNHGKPIALVTPVSDASLEDALAALRQARALEAVNRMQRLSLANGTDKLTPEMLEAEIAAGRRRR